MKETTMAKNIILITNNASCKTCGDDGPKLEIAMLALPREE